MTSPAPAELADFWARAHAYCLELLPANPPEPWAFGDQDLADELLDLVLEGKKTATCSYRGAYAPDGADLPQAGQIDVVLDGAGRPRAVLRITRVEETTFGRVDEVFAVAEGEGDRTLIHWRRVHTDFFKTTYGITADEQFPLVCEWFELLYAEK